MRSYLTPLFAFVGTALSWWFAMSASGGTWMARGILVGGMAATWLVLMALCADRDLAVGMHKPRAGDPTKGIAAAMVFAGVLWVLVSMGVLRSLVPQFQYVAATLRLVGVEAGSGHEWSQAAQLVALLVYALCFEGVWRGFVVLALEDVQGSRRAELLSVCLSVMAVVPAALVLSVSGKVVAFGAFWPLVHAVAAVSGWGLLRVSGRIIPGAIALAMMLVLVLSPARQATSQEDPVSVG